MTPNQLLERTLGRQAFALPHSQGPQVPLNIVLGVKSKVIEIPKVRQAAYIALLIVFVYGIAQAASNLYMFVAFSIAAGLERFLMPALINTVYYSLLGTLAFLAYKNHRLPRLAVEIVAIWIVVYSVWRLLIFYLNFPFTYSPLGTLVPVALWAYLAYLLRKLDEKTTSDA